MITSGVLGITTSSIAVWSARQNAKLARETRTQQRLADSYLEVLRIVEREAQRVEARITNWKLAAEEQAEFGIAAVIDGHVTGFERVKMPEPAITDRAIIAAHLAAFGSDNVCKLYQSWRFTVTEIGNEEDLLLWDAGQSYPERPGLDDLKRLRDALHPDERAARQALADAIAEELGDR